MSSYACCIYISLFFAFLTSFILPSCYSRFEIHPFFNEATVRAPSPLPSPPVSAPPLPERRESKVLVLAVVVPTVVVFLLLVAAYCFFSRRAKKAFDTASIYDDISSTFDDTTLALDGNEVATADSLKLDYRVIQVATNDFSESNKIGQGGFGEVYKGMFSNGTEVAVKRLSKTSGQGETEFKTEVAVFAKLQHRNLVKFLGFCLKGREKILVYEYVPNKSLDYFLFYPEKHGLLDWTQRYNIIGGIARGILYLNQDSRLTIIHRDLKPSNILLDVDMSPKIADFGIARIFGMDQTEKSTRRVAGTSGYMSPEYLMRGQFSMKSDVYSFGVLVLEIISGKKNSSFRKMDGPYNLVTYAWMLWRKGASLDLVAPVIAHNCQINKVVRCIHICLLCVQEDPVDRPTMSTIVLMLANNTVTLPMPQKPGFFYETLEYECDLTNSNYVPWSDVEESITVLYPR